MILWWTDKYIYSFIIEADAFINVFEIQSVNAWSKTFYKNIRTTLTATTIRAPSWATGWLAAQLFTAGLPRSWLSLDGRAELHQLQEGGSRTQDLSFMMLLKSFIFLLLGDFFCLIGEGKLSLLLLLDGDAVQRLALSTEETIHWITMFKFVEFIKLSLCKHFAILWPQFWSTFGDNLAKFDNIWSTFEPERLSPFAKILSLEWCNVA